MITLMPAVSPRERTEIPWGRTLLVLAAILWGVAAGRVRRSAWWGVPIGAGCWALILAATWEGASSLRVATRVGALFGGTPGWLMIVVTLAVAGVVAGALARATAALVPGDRAAGGGAAME